MDIEILKILSSSLTPITVAVVGYHLNKNINIINQQKLENNIIIEKRMSLYEKMALPLNNIYCFVNDVGSYKTLTPSIVIENKRQCDKVFYIYRPIWDQDVISTYKEFMSSAFEMFSRSGDDAKIRTISVEKINTTNWDDSWRNDITEERAPDFHKRYYELIDAMANNLRLSR